MRSSPILFLVALFAIPAAAGAAVESPAEIEACVRDNLPRESSIQTVVLRSTNRVGDSTESRAKLYWKLFEDGLSKVLLRFSDPVDMRDAGVLLIEQKDRRPDTFMYLPELKSVRRVSSSAASSSLFGTDFSYEDFERVVGMSADAEKERREDQTVEGREAWVVSARPDPSYKSSYERVVTFVDKETCVPLRIESYEPGDQLRKVLTTDAETIVRVDGVWIPRHQTMRDLRDQTRTEIVIEKIDVDAEIHRKMFSARELEAGAN